MSADPLYSVWCDYPDCPAWCEDQPVGGARTAAAARKIAKAVGWRVNAPTPPDQFPPRGGRSRMDFCPKHKEASRG